MYNQLKKTKAILLNLAVIVMMFLPGSVYAESIYGKVSMLWVNDNGIARFNFTAPISPCPSSVNYGQATFNVNATNASGQTLISLLMVSQVQQSPIIISYTESMTCTDAANVTLNDANSISDLFFHNLGDITVWTMYGNQFRAVSNLGSETTGYSMKAICDVDGDFDDDLVFQKTTGEIALWVLSKLTEDSIKEPEISLGSMGSYEIKSCRDTNKDGNNDLILQDNSGNYSVMLLKDDHSILATNWLGTWDPLLWSFAAMADVDADGDKDIIMQSAAGDIGVIILQNGNNVSSAWLGQWADWQVAGAGDADNDGDDDLFLSKVAGDIGIVKMQGGVNISSAWFGVWADTKVKAIGDINGDGDADVVFENETTGSVNVIDMGPIPAARWLFNISGYDVRGVADINGDGTEDILMQHNEDDIVAALMAPNTGLVQSTPAYVNGNGKLMIFP